MCTCVLNYFNHVQLFSALWTVARQTLLSMGFSRQEFWSGLTSPPPGDFPDPGIEPVSLTSPALAAGLFATIATWEAPCICVYVYKCAYIYIYIYICCLVLFSCSATSVSLWPDKQPPGFSVHDSTLLFIKSMYLFFKLHVF